jgi:hypothetical protein
MSDIRQPPELSREEILEGAIERLAAGESLDAILATSSADATWLEPLLIAAAGVRGLRQTVPVPPAEASLAAFLAQAEHMAPVAPAATAPTPWWERLVASLSLSSAGFPRLATTALATMLLVVILTLGSAVFLGNNTAAAQSVLPGQPLYPIKRLGEEVTLRLPQSSEDRDAKVSEYEERRRDEIHLLLGHQLEAQVAFRGEVEALGPNKIVVSDISLAVGEDTQIQGPLELGAQAVVVARTLRDGTLVAQRIVIVSPAPPTPTSAPTTTPKPTATATQEPTATPTLAPTDTPVRSESDTREPPPAPTATSESDDETPEGEDNENEEQDPGDGDGNENGDDGNENEDDDGNGNDDGNDNSGGDGGSDDNEDTGDNDDTGNDNEDNSDGGDEGDSTDDSGDGGNDNDGQDGDDDKGGSEEEDDNSNDSSDDDSSGSSGSDDDNSGKGGGGDNDNDNS